jgi:drug/metabolite transporter (DMT)-like permease
MTPLVISCAMVLAVRYLPLAEATVILFAGPFLVVAFSAPLLGERVPMASWLGVAIGFAAVLIVARPGLGALSAYTLFPLVAALFYALLQLITRRLGMAGERAVTTLVWTLATGGLVSTPFAILTWAPVTPEAWLLMLALGIVFAVSQLTMIRAYTFAPAELLAPFSYAQIISATILGALVFGDVPDAWTFLGIAMIIGAGIYVMRRRAG